MSTDSCETCKYWTPLENLFKIDGNGLDHWEDGWDASTIPIWGTCNYEVVHDDPVMFTVDASDYWSALQTRPTFSCQVWSSVG